jgi:ABC-type transporter Mla MlaB component
VPYSIASTQDGLILTLEGAVTVRHARDLATSLAEGLGDDTPVGVETVDLEDIDTSILQLLCSLRRAVPALSFDKPSQVFADAVDRCGLRRELLGAREGV